MRKRSLFVCVHSAARSQAVEGERGVRSFFPRAAAEIRRELPDLSNLAGTDGGVVAGVRRIRDAITGWIDATFGEA